MTESLPAHDVSAVAEEKPERTPEHRAGGGGLGLPIPGLATPPAGSIRRSGAATDEATHQKVMHLLVQRAGMTNGTSWQGTPEQQARLDEIDAEIAKLDPGALPGPENTVPSRAVMPAKKGLLGQAEDWIAGKLKAKAKDEVAPESDKLDEQLVWGMERAAERFKQAAKLTKDERQRKGFEDCAEKFENGAKQGKKIVALKENVELLLEFKKAVEEAHDADASTKAGAAKLLEVMHMGGKVGAKFLPPPLDVYFRLLAEGDLASLANVGQAYGDPGDPNSTTNKALKQSDDDARR